MALFNLGPWELLIIAVMGIGCPLAIVGIVLGVVFLSQSKKQVPDRRDDGETGIQK